jgi:BatD DUF11 like domain
MNRNRSIIGLVAWLVAAAPAVVGQQVSGNLSPQVIGAGQTAEYSISIDGVQSVEQLPTNLVVPGLEFNGPSSRSSMTLINGVLKQQTDFVWQIYAPKTGTFTIPAQQVTADGKTFTVPQKTLQVQEGSGPQQSLEPFLKLHVDKKEIFLGEVVPVTVTAFFHRRTQLRNYDPPKLPRDNFVVKRFPAPGPSASVEVKGERYAPIMFSSSLSAIKDGVLTLGPATLDCVVDFPTDDGGARNSAPGIPSFFQRMVTRQFHLESDPLTVTVKPLPTEDRPPDFAGAVGKFTLNARLNQPSQVHVNDPLAIDLTVAGQGNFDAISAPILSTSEGWKTYPARLTQENRSTGLEPGVVGYSQVIIPQKMAPEVPPFIFSYFDLDQQKYVTARSNSIALQMLPEEKPPDPRSGEAPTKDFATADAATPDEQLADILVMRPEQSELREINPQASDDTVFWMVQAIPAALVLTFAGIGLQRRLRASAEEKRRHRAGHPRSCAVIWRDMKRSSVPLRDFYGLAREYVESWQFHEGHRHDGTGPNGEVSDILSRHTIYCYGGVPEAAQPVPSPEKKQVLATLSRLGR